MGRRNRGPSEVPESPSTQWSVNDDTYMLSPKTVDSLPPGAYNCADDGWGRAMLKKVDVKLDELISFSGSVFDEISKRVDKFWSKADAYSSAGFLHRTGILCYGPQGCGKSSLIYQLMNKVVEEGHICLLCDGRADELILCTTAFRSLEPNRPLLCVVEDVDTHLARGSENELLQWLDGANKTDHVVTIATTNYPERLDRRVVCRPRRFDRVIYIDYPNSTIRYDYFKAKLNNTAFSDQVGKWVDLTDGLSLASLAELVLSVVCMEEDLETTASLLRQLETSRPNSQQWFTDMAEEEPDEDEEYTNEFEVEDDDPENLVVDSNFIAAPAKGVIKQICPELPQPQHSVGLSVHTEDIERLKRAMESLSVDDIADACRQVMLHVEESTYPTSEVVTAVSK